MRGKIKPSISKLENGNWLAFYKSNDGVVYSYESNSSSDALTQWYKKYSKELGTSSG